MSSDEVYVDESIAPKKGQLGYVDKSFLTTTENGKKLAKIRIRHDRIPAIGDKFCSRAGQKGTIGIVLEEQDMPYNDKGIRPDIIVNPHALPSRMTIGHLVEVLIGKACVLNGSSGDCTAFNNVGPKEKEFGSILTQNGFHSTGNEIMYNGMTGEQLETEIYFGPTFYLRLKHMVKDKINYRARGPRTVLTRQTVQGRANNGGLRIGEMDRDAILAHGMTNFMYESMMERGDKYYMAICNQSGTIAVYNESRNIFLSPMTDGPLQFTENLEGGLNIIPVSKYGRDFSIVKVPYAFKLLYQELQAMNVQMRLITADNVDELTTMKESNIVKLTGLNNLEEVAEATNKKLVKDNTAYKDVAMDRSIVEGQTQDSPLFEDWSGQADTSFPADIGFPADPTVPGVFSRYQNEMQQPPPVQVEKQKVKIKGSDLIWTVEQGPDEDGLYVLNNEMEGLEMKDADEIEFIQSPKSIKSFTTNDKVKFADTIYTVQSTSPNKLVFTKTTENGPITISNDNPYMFESVNGEEIKSGSQIRVNQLVRDDLYTVTYVLPDGSMVNINNEGPSPALVVDANLLRTSTSPSPGMEQSQKKQSSILQLLNIGEEVKLLDPEKYNKSTMPATYTLVTMDMATDKATIRSSENPIAFQVEAKDLGFLPNSPVEPDIAVDVEVDDDKSDDKSDEKITTLPQHDMQGGGEISSEGGDPPKMRITIKEDFNGGLDLLAPQNEEETNSGDENMEGGNDDIKKIG